MDYAELLLCAYAVSYFAECVIYGDDRVQKGNSFVYDGYILKANRSAVDTQTPRVQNSTIHIEYRF